MGKRAWREWSLVLVMSAVFLLPAVFSPRDFWGDETRYAEILREMVDGGHWFIPHLNGIPYPDKPPLYFWLVGGLSILLGGIKPLAGMWVTFAGAVGCMVLNYLIMVHLSDRRKALLSCGVLVSSFLFMACCSMVRMDVLMTFFVMAALYVFLLRHAGGIGEGLGDALYFLLTGMAVMSKGPLGAVFAFLPVLAYLGAGREWAELRRIFLSWRLLLAGLPVGLWLCGAWFGGNRELVRNILVEQVIGRATKGAIHEEPFFFYLLLLPFVLLPWSAVLPSAVRDARCAWRQGFSFLFAWFITGFVVISAISGKLFIYLLPVLPPVTMVIGWHLEAFLKGSGDLSRPVRLLLVSGLAVFGGTLSFVPVVTMLFPEAAGVELWCFPALLVPVLVAGVVAARLGRTRLLLGVVWVGSFAAMVATSQLAVPALNRFSSPRALGEELGVFLRGGTPVATCGVMRGILSFYADAVLPEIGKDELGGYLGVPGRVVVLRLKDYEKCLSPSQVRSSRVLSRHAIDGMAYLVVLTGSGDEGAR